MKPNLKISQVKIWPLSQDLQRAVSGPFRSTPYFPIALALLVVLERLGAVENLRSSDLGGPYMPG